MSPNLNFDIETTVNEIFHFLERITDVNIKDVISSNHFHGTIYSYSTTERLISIYKYIQTRDYSIAYEKEINLLTDKISSYSLSQENITDLPSLYEKFSEILKTSAEYIREYNIWNSTERVKFRNYLFNNEFLKEEEKTDEFLNKFNYEWVAAAKKSVENKLLQIYNFGNSVNSADSVLNINHNTPYFVSDALCISDDINLCIAPNKASDEEKFNISVALKLDKELLYSYFIITVHYKDKTWLVTDRPVFVNPRSKETSRNPGRRREDAFSNIELPYEILNDVDKWRQKSREIAKEKSSEIYIKSIKDYIAPESKILLKLIIEELVYNVIPQHQFDFKRISLFSDSVKLLASNSTNNISTENTDNFVNINKEENDKIINDIVFPKNTQIIKIDPITAVAKYSDMDPLCTLEEMENLVVWSEKEESRKNKQALLNQAYTQNKDADEEKLNRLLMDNIEKLYEVFLSGTEVYMKIKGEPNKQFGCSEDEERIYQISDNSEFKTPFTAMYLIDYKTRNYRSERLDPHCIVTGSTKPNFLNFCIFSYKQLCSILNIKREELPYIYQNYLAYSYRPYYGNSILDNVNPEYLLMDPFSKRHYNVFTIGVPLTKRSFNTLMKKYKRFEKSLVEIDYDNRTIEIKEYKKNSASK